MIQSEPEKKAIEIIEKYCIESPTGLNPEEIANAEFIIVEETDTNSFHGKIQYNDEYGLILINKNLNEAGAKRFTLAHELGHFFIEKEKRFFKHGCGFADIYGKARLENNANVFAAELLMHKPWFGNFIKDRKVSMDLMKEIAEYFSVSLTAAAVRYAEIGKYPTAVIMSTAGRVKWKWINEYFPLKWIPNGYKLREESSAYDFFLGKEVQTCDDLVPAHTWFSEDFKCPKDLYLYEQNVVMPGYNSVLTLLWKEN
jgi:Zn-dependent peptidase ImmA (M78 family)